MDALEHFASSPNEFNLFQQCAKFQIIVNKCAVKKNSVCETSNLSMHDNNAILSVSQP